MTEKRAIEAAYKRTVAELAKRQMTATAERLAINGVKLGSKELTRRFEKEVAEKLAHDLEKQAAKRVARKAAGAAARKVAGRVAARVVPFVGIVLTAGEALAMADHVSKGGTIEFGLSGTEADLEGDTDINTKGDEGGVAGGTLTDAKIDVSVEGFPDLSGTSQIEARSVTISGSVKGDGTPVTMSFTTKLQNTTITIKHGGVIKGGKVELAGGSTITDSKIVIDLPPGATAAAPGKPVTITGKHLTVTKVATSAGTGRTGDRGGAAESPKKPSREAEQKKVHERLAGLSDATKARLDSAGPATRGLVEALILPGPGKGVQVDDKAIDAILKTLKDHNVTEAEIEELRKTVGTTPATSLDEVIAHLESGIKGIRGKGKPGEPDAGDSEAGEPSAEDRTKPADSSKSPSPPVKPVDPKDPKFAGLPNEAMRIAGPSGKLKVGQVLKGRPAWGKRRGVPWEAVVTIKIVPKGALVVSSTQVRTASGTLKPWFVNKIVPRLGGRLPKG